MRPQYMFLIPLFLFVNTYGFSFAPGDSIISLPEGVVIIDLEKRITSFDELTTYFQGKAVFIDRWAPWCSPCLQEFEYVQKLHEFLDNNDVVMVYMNSDIDIELCRWVELIKKHNLKGYHLRLTWDLRYDMKEKEIDYPRLPQYMIVDKEGNVLEKNSLWPSAEEELYNQIKTCLKE